MLDMLGCSNHPSITAHSWCKLKWVNELRDGKFAPLQIVGWTLIKHHSTYFEVLFLRSAIVEREKYFSEKSAPYWDVQTFHYCQQSMWNEMSKWFEGQLNILTILYKNILCMTLLMTLWCCPIVFLIMSKLPNDSDKLWSNSSLHLTLFLILGHFSVTMLPS